MERPIDTTPTGTDWPELWALWDSTLGTDGRFVMAATGPCDGPEVYWSEDEAKTAAKYNNENYELNCWPVRITTKEATP